MTETTQNPAPDTTSPIAAEEAKRGRGRPSNADLDAREAALKEREEQIAIRLRDAELRAAEANAAMREAELAVLEANTTIVAARSGSARSGTVRPDVTKPVRRRQFSGDEMPDEFYIAPEEIPPDASYQWNNHSVSGQPISAAYTTFMARQGWEPVPTSRHPHMMPEGTQGSAPIIVGGQILVERPKELTREARQESYDKAIGEVRRKEEQLHGPAPKGQFQRARANGDTTGMVQVSKGFEPGEPVQRNYQYVDNPGMPVE